MKKTIEEFGSTRIGELLNTKLITFNPETTVSKVLGELEKNGRYEAIVHSDSKVGLITIRDILKVDQPNQTKLTRLWKPFTPVSPDDTVRDVAHELIDRNLRALPVVKDLIPIGIISQVDLIDALTGYSEIKSVKAIDLARASPITIEASEKISQARKTMLGRGISHLPVLKKGKLVGMVTAKDLVHTFIVPAERISSGDRVIDRVAKFPGDVADVMDKNPIILGFEATALDAVKDLSEQKKGACLIVDDQVPIYGIITPREILPLIARPKDEVKLPVYIMGFSPDEFLERSIVEEKVLRTLMRGVLIHSSVDEVLIKIKKRSRAGNRVRYELTGRVITPTRQYNVSNTGWDLLSVFDRLLDSLDRVLREAKSEPDSDNLARLDARHNFDTTNEGKRRRGRGRSMHHQY
jgi:CBS domain-containing protein